MKSLYVLFFATLFIFFASNVFSQERPEYGFRLGYNMGTQYGNSHVDIEYDVNSSVRHGFAGGLIVRFPITDFFSIQQEFIYSQKGSNQEVLILKPAVNAKLNYRLDYFELPVMFRYTIVNIKNFELYASSGFVFSILLKGKHEVNGNVFISEDLQMEINESGNAEGVDGFDYSFIYGLGCKFPILEQDCFFEYRQTIGWNILMMPTMDGIDAAPLRNMTYALSVGILF